MVLGLLNPAIELFCRQPSEQVLNTKLSGRRNYFPKRDISTHTVFHSLDIEIAWNEMGLAADTCGQAEFGKLFTYWQWINLVDLHFFIARFQFVLYNCPSCYSEAYPNK